MHDTTKMKANFNLIAPFGPRIGEFTLNDYVTEAMLELTDEMLLDSTRQSHGEHLAGQINEEVTIPRETFIDTGLYAFFNQITHHYVSEFIENHSSLRTAITEARIVSQYENEYNPAHWHENCSVSAVMYLKVPDFSKRKITSKRRNPDGEIVFINKSSIPGRTFENALVNFKPEVGKLYMFPSYLLHAVYPFQGIGERRSVSFNAVHETDKHDNMSAKL